MNTRLQYMRTILLSIFCLTLFVFSATAQQAKKISLQGFLKDADGKAIPNTNAQEITFKLYPTETGGVAEWSETQSLKVTGGVYSTHLGISPNAITNGVAKFEDLSWGSKTYFVGVTLQGTELTPRTELTFAPYSLGSPFAQKAQEVVCSGAVGDVKHSILNPTQFAVINGDCWVPMDGRNIAGSKLATILNITSLPNGGGMFLRAQEFSNSGNTDPERNSNSPIATLQEQSMQTHQHSLSSGSISTAGSHVHGMEFRFNGTYTAGGDATHVNQMTGFVNIGNNPGIATQRNSTNVKFAAEDRNTTDYVQAGFDTGGAGSHSHSLSGNSGDNNGYSTVETRPKNLNFWIYIRIN